MKKSGKNDVAESFWTNEHRSRLKRILGAAAAEARPATVLQIKTMVRDPEYTTWLAKKTVSEDFLRLIKNWVDRPTAPSIDKLLDLSDAVCVPLEDFLKSDPPTSPLELTYAYFARLESRRIEEIRERLGDRLRVLSNNEQVEEGQKIAREIKVWPLTRVETFRSLLGIREFPATLDDVISSSKTWIQYGTLLNNQTDEQPMESTSAAWYKFCFGGAIATDDSYVIGSFPAVKIALVDGGPTYWFFVRCEEIEMSSAFIEEGPNFRWYVVTNCFRRAW